MPHIQVKPFTVSPTTPFDEDFFGRQKLVESLCNLSLKIEEPLVIGLKAPWGHGKSIVIERLEAHINNAFSNKIGIIKYDAYKNDYVSDVFVSISSSISSYLDKCEDAEDVNEKKQNISSAKEQFLKSGGNICKLLFKNAAIRGIKYTSAGIIDLPEISSDIEELIEGTVSDSATNIVNESTKAVDDLINERLTESNKDQALLTKFTEDLNNALITTEKNRLIFVIDELDRCRPSFSVEVLEKIKHFFSCENVLFILVYNKEQLQNSITHIYGVNNPSVYLQRFIDLESDISINNADLRDNNTTRSFIEYVVNKHEFTGDWPDTIAYVLKNSFSLFGSENSLRAIERVCTRVAAYCLIRKTQEFDYNKNLIVTLCMLMVCKPKYFESIFERAKLISRHRVEDNQLAIHISDVEPVLREYLTLIKTSNHNIFNRMYAYIIYYLQIIDDEVNSSAFPRIGGFVNRKHYIKNCCGLISIFSME